MALLGVHGQDVVGGQGVIVEHGHQVAALQLRLDLPGGAPAQAHTFTHPAVQQLAVVAVQVALHAHGYGLALLLKIPTPLLAPLQVECQAIVVPQVVQRAGFAVFAEVGWCATHHALVGREFDGHKVRVDGTANTQAQVVTFTHQVDYPVGEVEG